MKTKSSDTDGLMASLEKFTGGKISDSVLELPEVFGKGYLKNLDLGPRMNMMVQQYVLKKDITIKKNNTKNGKDLITFSFRNLLQPEEQSLATRLLPSVQVSSGDLDFEVFTPAGKMMNTIIITVHLDLLKDLLNNKEENKLLQKIISGDQPYLYDQLVSPDIQALAAKLFAASPLEQLNDFYFKMKGQEMIYFFLIELLKRQSVNDYPLNVTDVKAMYAIRDRLMVDLSVQPKLSELVLMANMSESKMKRMFKQIFGNSIYHYYQTLRMNEASYLIREDGITVSEAGYRLGFSNLSHFTRLFEKHMGIKPKKYSTLVKL